MLISKKLKTKMIKSKDKLRQVKTGKYAVELETI